MLANVFQVWPEVTDPEKFVYEDVAIASYLLVRTHVTCTWRRGAGAACHLWSTATRSVTWGLCTSVRQGWPHE